MEDGRHNVADVVLPDNVSWVADGLKNEVVKGDGRGRAKNVESRVMEEDTAVDDVVVDKSYDAGYMSILSKGDEEQR